MSESNTTDKGNTRRTDGKTDLPDSNAVHSAPKGDDAATTFAEHDLSSFQRYILTILADESRYGLAIKRELEALYGDEVNHGRLYPNLDELVELGFIDKSELDKRTNQYELTDEGRDALKDQLEWELQRVDPPHGGDEA